MEPDPEKCLDIIWVQGNPAFYGIRQHNPSTGCLQTDPATSNTGILISLVQNAVLNTSYTKVRWLPAFLYFSWHSAEH